MWPWRCPKLSEEKPADFFRPNVWLGTTVENQEYADKRIPELLKCHDLARRLFVSAEPLLGPIDLTTTFDVLRGMQLHGPLNPDHGVYGPEPGIDWVIAGGESGPDARPSHPEWFRSLRDQCGAAGVPFHFKQWGEWQNGSDNQSNGVMLNDGTLVFPDTLEARKECDKRLGFRWNQLNPTAMSKVGVKRAGRLLDGVIHDAFPMEVHS